MLLLVIIKTSTVSHVLVHKYI